MKGFLSDGLRDVLSVASFALGITGVAISLLQLYLAFGPNRKGTSLIGHATAGGTTTLRNESLVNALRRCWIDPNSDVDTTFFVVVAFFVLPTLLVLVFNINGAGLMPSAIIKDLGLVVLLSDIDVWLKKQASKTNSYLFRGLVAITITLILLIPPLFLGQPTTEGNRLQNLYTVELMGAILIGLWFLGYYILEGIKYTWTLLVTKGRHV